MSNKRNKSIRKQVKKQSNKIKLNFLYEIEKEPLNRRLKIAYRIIFKTKFEK